MRASGNGSSSDRTQQAIDDVQALRIVLDVKSEHRDILSAEGQSLLRRIEQRLFERILRELTGQDLFRKKTA